MNNKATISIASLLLMEDKRQELLRKLDEVDLEISIASEKLLGVKPGETLTSGALAKAIYKVIEEYGDGG